MAAESLKIDSVFFRYKTVDILRGVFLHVRQGRICCLYGLNGSGKTTLIKIAAGFLRPASGAVFIDNRPLNEYRINEHYSQIAYLSQGRFLPDDLKVSDIIKMFPHNTAKLLVDEVIAKIVKQKISSLSIGEQRYLEVNLILSLQRQFTLLDEPFTGLEPKNIERIIKKIMDVKKDGRSVLLTDHYQQYVTLACDDAYLLHEGRCIPTPTVSYHNMPNSNL